MSFANELVSEEDIKYFGLDEIKKRFDPWAWRNGRPEGFVHDWTVDRERNIFFMPVKAIEEPGPSGRPEPTSKQVCALNFAGTLVTLVIERTRCPSSFYETPFQIAWRLSELDLSDAPLLSRDQVIAELKAALSVYGYRGAHRQVPNTIVEFSF